ncbi:MAG: glutathione S-transferase family protein [Alphaproteobacteria bacterium]|nr:glutathione S-transferase family protein [Alphaproteobacteria bacterium]
MAITIYGSARSRANRCTWALKEMGVSYDQKALTPDQLKGADYLKVNPQGKVPTMQDGDLTMSESLAINMYFARKYKKLWPASEKDQAAAEQWALWSATEAEPHAITMLVERAFKPADKRDAAKANAAEEAFKPRMEYLNTYLANRKYLIGSDFTIADLNAAACIAAAVPGGFKMESYPNVKRWLDACTSRQAYKDTRA